MFNILITSAGQRVSLIRAFQKETRIINPNNKVYAIDSCPILAPACHVSDGYMKVKKVDDINYIEELLSICIGWDIKILIPTIDTELTILSSHIGLFYDNGIRVIVSDFEFVKTCRDKRLTNIFFLNNGIRVPKPIDKDNLEFPLFIKPYDGSLSRDIYVIKSKQELNNYHLTNPKLMFMEYIDQSLYDEFTVDTYYNKNNVVSCIVPRKRLVVRAGEINKGLTIKNNIVQLIKEKLNCIPGAIGCLTMQFFFNQKTNDIVGIEINPRFGGGFPLSYLAGANFPRYIIDEYIFDKKIEYFEDWESNLLMLRYDDEILVHNYNE